MRNDNYAIMRPGASSVPMNQVLRNTYFLLSLTLLFSAVTAGLAVISQIQQLSPILAIVGWFGLYFLTVALRNSRLGLLAIFAFTGFTGFMLGPVLNIFMHGFANGPQLVMAALGSTGVIFIGLSAFVLITKKDFSFMGGILFVALLVGLLASVGGILFNIPMLYIATSAGFVLIASGLILYDTSRIIHNGEQNYIMATIQLYMDIYMLFINLLNILSYFGGRRN